MWKDQGLAEDAVWRPFTMALAFYCFVTFLSKLGDRFDTVAFSAIRGLPAFPLISSNGIPELAAVLALTTLSVLACRNRVLLLIEAVLISYFSVSYFTVHGAFTHFVAISLLFFVVFKDQDIRKASTAARMTLGLMYLFAAFHKCNHAFLAGFELRMGDFYYGSRPVFRPLLRLLSSHPSVPPLMIATEILIGVSCLVGSSFGALSVLLFCIFLNFLQPRVSVVFFALLPLLLLGYPWLIRSFGFLRRPDLKKWALFIAAFGISFLALTLLTNRPERFGIYDFLGAFMLALCVPAFLNRDFLVDVRSRICQLSGTIPLPRITFGLNSAWAIAFALYCALPLLFPIPEPFSFTMFSGRNFLGRARTLPVANEALCQEMASEFVLKWAGVIHFEHPEAENRSPACTVYLSSDLVRAELRQAICKESRTAKMADKLCD